jgi:single-stranded-DNA-specific exonuclease
MIALDGERGRASARSIDAFDLLAGLTACADHLVGFGGHRAAAGLEIERGRVADFAAALDAHAEIELAGRDALETERVDAIVSCAELDMELAEELRYIAPFGRGNPGVSLMVSDACFADVRPMGEGKHVRFTVEADGARARAVAFGNGGRLPVADGEAVEATFTLEVNEWNGVSEPRLVLRRAQARPGPTATAEQATEPPSELVASAPTPDREPTGEAEELVLFALP